jgi:hypothetical protein
MEKVIIKFSLEALDSFEELKKGTPFISQMAVRYYNELFEIPPEKWGRIRRENNTDTFVSEKHFVFDIRGVIEDTLPTRTLNITHFELRKKVKK